MPRPCILHERKEEAPRGRSWDHLSKKTHRLCLNVISSGKQMEYSHLVANCRNMWWGLERSLVTPSGRGRVRFMVEAARGQRVSNFSHHSCQKGYCSLHMVVWSPSLSRSGYSPAPSWLPLWAQPPLPSPVALLLLEWIWMEPHSRQPLSLVSFTSLMPLGCSLCPVLFLCQVIVHCWDVPQCVCPSPAERFELFGLLMITSSCYKYLSANFCENIRFHFS